VVENALPDCHRFQETMTSTVLRFQSANFDAESDACAPYPTDTLDNKKAAREKLTAFLQGVLGSGSGQAIAALEAEDFDSLDALRAQVHGLACIHV
jgi:hypothetical protein